MTPDGLPPGVVTIEEAAARVMARIWYLARGGVPTPASARRPPADAVYWAREGDAAWSMIDPDAPPPTVADGKAPKPTKPARKKGGPR